MPKLIFISGLGADETVFQRINPIKGYESVFIQWKPIDRKYTITSYTKHLIEDISINPNDIIIGLSFGGLIAIDLAKQYQLKKIVLLSSFRDKRDLKFFIQPAFALKLYKLIPNFKLSNFSRIFRHYFNLVSGEGEAVLSKMLNKQDPKFTKWAIHQMAPSEGYHPRRVTTSRGLQPPEGYHPRRFLRVQNISYFHS